jgi:hypothetical protein
MFFWNSLFFGDGSLDMLLRVLMMLFMEQPIPSLDGFGHASVMMCGVIDFIQPHLQKRWFKLLSSSQAFKHSSIQEFKGSRVQGFKSFQDVNKSKQD